MTTENERTDNNWSAFEIPAVAAADTSTVILGSIPRKAHITAFALVPRAAVTANATNYATITLQNLGPQGSGSTAVASRAWSAANSVAGTQESGTLSGTAANLEANAGDRLQIVHSSAGSGLALPAMSVLVGWLPRF